MLDLKVRSWFPPIITSVFINYHVYYLPLLSFDPVANFADYTVGIVGIVPVVPQVRVSAIFYTQIDGGIQLDWC